MVISEDDLAEDCVVIALTRNIFVLGHKTPPRKKNLKFKNQKTFETLEHHFSRWNQCDQIGRFLKVLDNKFSYKSSQNICQLYRLFG